MFGFLTMACLMVGMAFAVIYLKEPRTLWLGSSFLAMVMTLGITLATFLITLGQVTPVLILAIIVGLLLFFLPTIIIIVFLSSGVTIIRREGLRLTNILAFGAGLMTIAYLTIWPWVGDMTQHNVMSILYAYISSLALYFIVLLNLYTLTTALNLIHFNIPQLDYLVVLGAGLDGDKVTPLLASRIDKAIQLYHRQPSVQLIMTGGQGDDELIAEGLAMANYALAKDLPSEAVIIEDRAVNTEENIAFSQQLMTKEKAKFAVVSNNYHVFRALLLAREQGLKCIGFGAKTKWYFAINAFIREFIGYLYLKRKFHLIVITIFTIGFTLLQALIIYINQYID